MPLPLHGKRIVVTRAEQQAGDFARHLTELGAEVLTFPTIQTVAPASWESLDRALAQLHRFDWIFFTSANAVTFFFQRWRELHQAIPFSAPARVCAIGKATAAALEKQHLAVDLIPAESKAEGVLEAFCHFYGGSEQVSGLRVLLPRAETAREILPEELPKIGVSVEVATTYRTIRPQGDFSELAQQFLNRKIDVVTFTSPSTFHHFGEMFSDVAVSDLLQFTAIACIGPVTAEAVRQAGLAVAIQPAAYTVAALAAAIGDFFQQPKQT
ncbi:MAG: uroporphyrinogen-III synthase [Blastocatellia bacterium]|nr:uroporphyrinogen-III synthase [Blastocatellia bacterium]